MIINRLVLQLLTPAMVIKTADGRYGSADRPGYPRGCLHHKPLHTLFTY